MSTLRLMPPGELAQLMRQRLFDTHFQPILDPSAQRIIGHEALVRGAPGSAFASPLELFEYATAEGKSIELERQCTRVRS
jgi:EAL domain-containing protein (putative c-di-GMP-specific phosphodiesterase class I)